MRSLCLGLKRQGRATRLRGSSSSFPCSFSFSLGVVFVLFVHNKRKCIFSRVWVGEFRLGLEGDTQGGSQEGSQEESQEENQEVSQEGSLCTKSERNQQGEAMRSVLISERKSGGSLISVPVFWDCSHVFTLDFNVS